jgi:hypothetical protein
MAGESGTSAGESGRGEPEAGTGGESGSGGEHGESGTAGTPEAGTSGEGGTGGSRSCDSASELVVNGDFDHGDFAGEFFDIDTEYVPVTAPTQLTDTGQCTIATDPSGVRLGATDWAAYGDHTTGSSQMLICDGATVEGRQVWLQTVVVEPNTNYRFSFWFSNVEVSSSLPALAGYAGVSLLGPALVADPTPGVWVEYAALWNSGSNTSIALSIVDANTDAAQNDFSLDDISLARACE